MVVAGLVQETHRPEKFECMLRKWIVMQNLTPSPYGEDAIDYNCLDAATCCIY